MEKKKQKKHKKLWQRILLMMLPCVLFFAAIFCISYWLFQAKVVDSPFWSLLVMSDSTLSDDGTVINTQMQNIDLDEIDGYYDAKDFPKISWGEQWAKLSIESHGVKDAPVVLGDGDDILNQMVIGHYFSSKYPGQGGKVVLDSHVSGPFHCIEDMSVGEKVVLDTIYGTYEYEVSEIVIFDPSEKKWVQQDDSGEETLFFYTCYPRAAAYRTQRIGVVCKLISGIPWK